MSNRTQNVLQFIKNYRTRHGFAPTRREIGKACNLSTSVVSRHLGILQDAGHLTVARDVARGIVLVEEPEGEWVVLNQIVKETEEKQWNTSP